MKKWMMGFSAVAALMMAGGPVRAATIFTENMGTPGATTGVSTYTGFQNSGVLTYSGTGDVRTSTASAGYAGASGNGNVFLTNSGTASFVISAIDTSAYQPGTLDISFGAYKSTTASNMSELSFEYSTNGTTWSSIPIPAQATGGGTAVWRLLSFADTALPITSTLYLRWIDTSSGVGTPQFRLDDIALTGDLAAVPEPSTCLLACIGLVGLVTLCRRRKAAAARA